MDLREHARAAAVCLPTNTVSEVADLMRRERADTVVVIDLDLRPVGMVSSHRVDVARRSAAHGPHAPIAHVQRKAVSIGYRRSPRDAALHMQAWGAKRVVVLSEDGTVAGMLRAEDLAPALDADEYVGSSRRR